MPCRVMKEISNKFHQRELTEVMNTWKSYMTSAGWRIIWKKIIAVIDATFALAKRKSEKKKSVQKIQAFFSQQQKSCVSNCDDLLSCKRTKYNTYLVIFIGKPLKLENMAQFWSCFKAISVPAIRCNSCMQQTAGNNIVLNIKPGSLFVEFIWTVLAL